VEQAAQQLNSTLGSKQTYKYVDIPIH